MDWTDFSIDEDYFIKLWEYSRPGKRRHTADIWDQRADEWKEELKEDTAFRNQTDQRVNAIASYLRDKGLLKATDTVIDIGCGPGRFVAEFAKTANYVVGLDISPKMAKLGESYAQSLGIDNTSFVAGDFKEMNPKEMGWQGKFDLVFSSVTPAIGTYKALLHSMEMSKGYCFNCCPISGFDSLRSGIAKEVFGITSDPKHLWDRRWFYSLFNILWLKGYLPETKYYTNHVEENIEINQSLIDKYTSDFSHLDFSEDIIREKITEYLKKSADDNGLISQKLSRGYGWILWNVTLKENYYELG